jgi:hypothetical protein
MRTHAEPHTLASEVEGWVAASPDDALAVSLLVCRQPRVPAGLTNRWPLAVATLICQSATLILAPVASADTDPLVPYGTDPHSSYVLRYHVSNHDESSTTNGQLDTAF